MPRLDTSGRFGVAEINDEGCPDAKCFASAAFVSRAPNELNSLPVALWKGASRFGEALLFWARLPKPGPLNPRRPSRTGHHGTKGAEHIGAGQGLAAVAALMLFATGLLCSLPNRADAEQIILRLHHFNSPKAIAHRLFMQPWADEIEKKSEGKVKVQVFPAMQLGGRPADLYGQARDGVVDIIWTIPGYSPGRFPLTEVFELPFLIGNATAASQALTEFHQKWLRDEYSDTHPLVFHSTAPTHLHTVGKQIRIFEDLKGMKIRTPSRVGAENARRIGRCSGGHAGPCRLRGSVTGRGRRDRDPMDHHASVPSA